MKTLSMILTLILLAGCAGMGTSSGISNSGEHMSGPDKSRMNDRNDFPSSIYFGD